MKRFYREVTAEDGEIRLDGRPVRTPAGHPLRLPGDRLAQAVAEEWRAQGERVDPRSMPITGLANAAIDRVAPDKEAFATGLARYGDSDLLCYRAEGPAGLVERQAGLWDPLLAWARRRYDIDFEIVRGVIPRAQNAVTLDRLARAVHARSPFELAGLSPLVTLSGSLVVGLAVAEGAAGVDQAWSAAALDEQWQAEQWGEDADAAKALEARRGDFAAAARFLLLL
ncbi:MAG TPA: ATP12 family protein [Allosphingosinicella sp.]